MQRYREEITNISCHKDAGEQILSRKTDFDKDFFTLYLRLPDGRGGLIIKSLTPGCLSVFPASVLALGNHEIIDNKNMSFPNTAATQGCLLWWANFKSEEAAKRLRIMCLRAVRHQKLTDNYN